VLGAMKADPIEADAGDPAASTTIGRLSGNTLLGVLRPVVGLIAKKPTPEERERLEAEFDCFVCDPPLAMKLWTSASPRARPKRTACCWF